MTDTRTGLVWDQCSYGASGSDCLSGAMVSGMGGQWAAAFNLVSSANGASYKGHNDWRLPNKNELESLLDRSLGGMAAKIDASAFPNTQGTTAS